MTSTLTVRELFVSAERGSGSASLRLPLVPEGLSRVVTGAELDADPPPKPAAEVSTDATI